MVAGEMLQYALKGALSGIWQTRFDLQVGCCSWVEVMLMVDGNTVEKNCWRAERVSPSLATHVNEMLKPSPNRQDPSQD